MDAFRATLLALHGKPSEVIELIGSVETSQRVRTWAGLVAGGASVPPNEPAFGAAAYQILVAEIL